MIIFNPSKTSKLNLVSVNEILKEGLEKNKEITFYSGDIIKAFLKIEIGENFYYIEKTDIKSGKGCPYFFSERKLKDVIQEGIV